MTEEMEHIGKILVEAEGGCWHGWEPDNQIPSWRKGCPRCLKCDESQGVYDYNPDFSKWENFGRLLKIALLKGIDVSIEGVITTAKKEKGYGVEIYKYPIETSHNVLDIDQIPALVATELAKILEEK